jgi:signal transduction histidine kinase
VTAPIRQPVRILIVDDVESNLVALEALLASPSVDVVRARSGQEAVRALRKEEFAVILLDVRMPGMDGFETAAAIRTSDGARSIPIIFVTAHGSTQDQLAKAYALGASDFIQKPIDPEQLRAKVRVLTDLARAVRDVRLEADAKHQQQLREERQRWETEALRARVADQERATASEHAARMEAENANRLKDEFLATLSHELRSPLNAIVGWAALVKARGPVEPSFSKGIDVIERNARAQVKLIEDMLDTSRIAAGTLRLDLTRVEIGQLIDRGVEAIRPVVDRKRLRMAVEVDEGLPPVAADPDRLQQVLGNILSNAVKFTPEEGQIWIRASRQSSSITVTVSDTGLGIAPDFLPHVFDCFRQGQPGRTRSHGGLGIGLSLARKLVELHGGTVEARSDGKGKGATFAVRLPVRAVAMPNDVDTRARSFSTAAASLSNLRALIVDDEVDARDLVREVLESSGAAVLAAGSAAEALAAMASWRPDVIISDVGMPGRDGYSLLQEIRALADASLRDVPAIALTAYASHDEAERARAAGFQVHLAKPVEPAHLIATVASLLSPGPARSIA